MRFIAILALLLVGFQPALAAVDKVACRLASGATTTCPGDATLSGTLTADGVVVSGSGGVVTLGGAQTIAGLKTFSAAPIMSGASITSATIPVGALALSATQRMFPDPSAALANITICGNGTSWAIVPAAPTGWLYAAGASGCNWVNALSGSTITFTNIPAGSALTGQVPVANGGTNKASWTVGSIPVATASTTIGEISPGTAAQVLTSNGTGAAPTMQALPTATTGSASLSTAQYDITTTNTYEDIGLSVGLPSAGTYLVSAEVRTFCQTSASPPGYVTCKLYNSTDAADVTNSERFGAVDYTNNGSTDTLPIRELITIAASKTIKVYCKTNSGPTFVNRGAASGSIGRSRISYLKLSS